MIRLHYIYGLGSFSVFGNKAAILILLFLSVQCLSKSTLCSAYSVYVLQFSAFLDNISWTFLNRCNFLITLEMNKELCHSVFVIPLFEIGLIASFLPGQLTSATCDFCLYVAPTLQPIISL